MDVLRWFVAPGAVVAGADRPHAVGLAFLRILLGLLWLYNAGWKVPPEFGRDTGRQLYGYVVQAVEEPVVAPYSWLMEQVVLPNYAVFGWGVLVLEAALGAFLLAGAFTRVVGLLAAGQAVAIGLAVLSTPGEWPWGYYMLAGISLTVSLTSAGRYAGVDGVRARGTTAAALRGLSVTAIVVGAFGAVATVVGLLSSPTGSPGTRLGSPEYEVTIGMYNALGGVVLVVVAGLLAAAARGRSWALGSLGSGVAGVAALSVLLQWGRSEVWLGGDGTTFAAFLGVAVAGGVLSDQLRRSQR